jgi:hypothetical protein
MPIIKFAILKTNETALLPARFLLYSPAVIAKRLPGDEAIRLVITKAQSTRSKETFYRESRE